MEKEKIINDILLKNKSLEILDYKYLDDLDIALVGVKKNPWNYIYLSDGLKNNKKIGLLAVRKSYKLYSQLAPQLREDKDIAIEVLKHDIRLLKNVSENIRNKNIIKDILKNITINKNELEVYEYLEIIKICPGFFSLDILKKESQSVDLIKTAIQDNQNNINYLSDHILNNYSKLEKVIVFYCKESGRDFNNEKIITKEFAEYLLIHNINSFNYVKNVYKKDIDFINNILNVIKKFNNFKRLEIFYALEKSIDESVFENNEIFEKMFNFNCSVISKRKELILESPYFEKILKERSYSSFYYMDSNKLTEEKFWMIYNQSPISIIKKSDNLMKDDKFCIELYDRIKENSELNEIIKSIVAMMSVFKENSYIKNYLESNNKDLDELNLEEAIISLKRDMIKKHIKKSEISAKKVKF